MNAIPNDVAMLALALLLDVTSRELPTRFHPTAWMGRTVALATRRHPSGSRAALLYGAATTLVITGGWAAAAFFAVRGLGDIHEAAYVLGGAALLSTTFAVKALHLAAFRVRNLLSAGSLDQVREHMAALVSRDTTRLTASQAGAAAVESVSENMSDGFIGPWLAFALFGLPGAAAYRAINTLDSMIGYHGRYELLGKASARLDDLVNLLPSRITGILIVAASALLPGQSAQGAWRVMGRDHHLTESPNAGWPMSAMAGALGVQLEKAPETGGYSGGYSLGGPNRPVEPGDITHSVRSMYLVAALGLPAGLALTYLRSLYLW